MNQRLINLLNVADDAVQNKDWKKLSTTNLLLEFYGFQVTPSATVKNVKIKDAFGRVFKKLGVKLTQKSIITRFYEGWASMDTQSECPVGLSEQNRWAWFEGKKHREIFEYDNL